MSESNPLVSGSSSSAEQTPIYYDETSSPKMKLVTGLFLGVVGLVLLVSVVIISVFSGIKNHLFVMLLLSLISFAQLEFFLVFFIHREWIPKKYFWIIFIVGVCVVIECINTDIIVLTT